MLADSSSLLLVTSTPGRQVLHLPWCLIGCPFRALPDPSGVWSLVHVPLSYLPLIQDNTTVCGQGSVYMGLELIIRCVQAGRTSCQKGQPHEKKQELKLV